MMMHFLGYGMLSRYSNICCYQAKQQSVICIIPPLLSQHQKTCFVTAVGAPINSNEEIKSHTKVFCMNEVYVEFIRVPDTVIKHISRNQCNLWWQGKFKQTQSHTSIDKSLHNNYPIGFTAVLYRSHTVLITKEQTQMKYYTIKCTTVLTIL